MVAAGDTGKDGGWLGKERLLAFSDGVVAIGLTLLVLPLAELVPEAREHEQSGFHIITENLAPIGSFLLSFVVIARFWAEHHRVFDDADRVSPGLIRLNTLWLFSIVVLPFPTEMVGTFAHDPFTVRFYVGTLFVSSALLTAMAVLVGRILSRERRLARQHPTTGSTAGLLLLVFLITLVFPQWSYWPLLLLLLTGPLEHALTPWARRRLERGV
jgi:uncharacterized membrane protein